MQKRSSTPEVWRPDLDAELFRAAMSGVQPLAQKVDRFTNTEPPSPRPSAPSLETKLRRAQAEGGGGLEARWLPDGTVEAVRRGNAFALEALTRFATPQETLDLHGLEAHEAGSRASEFVRTRRARGLRCVCVVTGRGKRSPDGASVLLDAVVKALSAAPAAGEVDALASAPEHLGGAGALLVSLRPR